MGDGGGSGLFERGVPSSSSETGDVIDPLDALEPARPSLAVGPLALDLIEPASDLSPGVPSSVANAPAEALGLSVDSLRSDFELPGIFERIDPRNERDEPWVSDLLKDGRLESESGVKFVDEEFLGVREPSLPFDCCWPITNGFLVPAQLKVGGYANEQLPSLDQAVNKSFRRMGCGVNVYAWRMVGGFCLALCSAFRAVLWWFEGGEEAEKFCLGKGIRLVWMHLSASRWFWGVCSKVDTRMGFSGRG